MTQPAQPEDSGDEDPVNIFFHDPSWPTPWSHLEFTGSDTERYKRWRQQPWFKNKQRSSMRLLRRAYGKCWPWGYFIYRTVYTPESDQVWSACLEKLDRYVHWEIDRVDGDRYSEADDQDLGFPEKLVHESYKNIVLEDKERWDGASIEQIRRDFKDLVASRGAEIGDVVPRYAVCLVIDQHCLDSRAFEDPEESRHGGGPGKGFILMIDPEFAPGHRKEGYFWFMRVEINELFWLTVELNSSFLMSDRCLRAQPGKIPVYDGGLLTSQYVKGTVGSIWRCSHER
ncbi:hypothetical protein GB937_009617 [Aspergillus fischeri]|nr:hypothetical protein GB937_009617 [Aspergillus fischeri]